MKKWLIRSVWMATGAVALYAAFSFAVAVSGGPIDPPGPVGPTYKSLALIPPSWVRILSADDTGDPCNSSRFACVMSGEAVLDLETGLAWDRTPFTNLVEWTIAISSCGDSLVGGRGGWRLPTDTEIRSLLDTNSSGQPLLPDGHPFNLFGPFGIVWTASAAPTERDLVYAVDTDTLNRIPSPKTELLKKWCVRGVQADAPPEDSAEVQEPPAWYQTLDATGSCFSERFRCVLNDEGVLDRETGLVWRRSPDQHDVVWLGAKFNCVILGLSTLGPSLTRHGWRLPSAEELLTILALNAQPDRLPVGHPFIGGNFLTQEYWTSTDDPADTAKSITIGGIQDGSGFHLRDKATFFGADGWCVRGGYRGP